MSDCNYWTPNVKTCPICNKRFVPAPEHAYKIGSGYKDVRKDKYANNIRLVCSYSCMRKWEIEKYGPRDRSKYE